MGSMLDAEHEEMREAFRGFADAVVAPRAAQIDRTGEFPTEVFEQLQSSGYASIGLPEEYGGDGADTLTSALVVEEVARACASTSTILTTNKLGTVPIVLFGTEEQKSFYLGQVAAGEAMIGYALSEREAGSDVGAMRCRATEQADGSWVLNGTKAWITNAGIAKYMVLFAVTDPELGAKGISAFLVHDDDEDVSYSEPEHKMGLRGSITREVLLDKVHVPADRLLGPRGKGMRIALTTLSHTRVSIGAQALGIAQGALDLAIDYVKDRRQFGQAIADFQGIQWMLADMAIKLETARSLVYRAAQMSQDKHPDLTYFGAIAKTAASDAAMSITTDAVQLLGGAGYTVDFPVERMMRDAKITQIYEGTNQIQKIVISRHLLH